MNPAGQLTSETWSGSVSATLNYYRDGGENLTTLRSDSLTNDQTSDELQTSTQNFPHPIQYDAQGNMTSFRNQSASWNLDGTLESVGDLSQIEYDADGHRLAENSSLSVESFDEWFASFDPFTHDHRPSPEPIAGSGGSWWWGYDGDRLLVQVGEDSAGYVEQGFYVSGPTGPIMELGANGAYATYMFDPNGSIVNRIWSNTTGLESPTLFDAYGLTVRGTIPGFSFPGNGPMPLFYKAQAGYVTDAGLGGTQGVLVQCQHRWYDPYSGRWLSRDPAGLEGGENAYEFCSGNPLMRVDPTGLDDWFDNLTQAVAGVGHGLTGGLTGAISQAICRKLGYDEYTYGGEYFTYGDVAGMGLGVVVDPMDAVAVLSKVGAVGHVVQTAAAIQKGYKFEKDVRAALGLSRQAFRALGTWRFADGFRLVDRAAFEMKSGNVTLTKFVARQIAKDADLLRRGEVNSVSWIFQKGAKISESVMDELVKNGISVSTWVGK